MTYILIGAIFGFLCNLWLSYVVKTYKMQPQIPKEFGLVENIMLIFFWPLCLIILIIGFIYIYTKVNKK